MRTRWTLLRILVFTGCLPLAVKKAGVVTVGAQGLSCTNFGNATQENCPSGCTSGAYTTYPPINGNGFYTATQNTTPCSPSTCTQPIAYNQPTPNCGQPPCCLVNLTNPCSATECAGTNDPCCSPAECIDGSCCYPNGTSCTSGVQCCAGLCPNNRCCASQTGGSCKNPVDCCGTFVGCINNTCCVIAGGSCTQNSNCCSSLICNTYDYTCTTCSGAGGPCGGTPDCCPGSKLECKLPQKTCCVAKGGDCVDGSVCCSGVCNDFCECTG